ncbi:hypothetical protein CAPTEDRAFT_189518 [Capitella teleta]|nr:hypothetical protein CAPTEDRAFT_189518 [Capitella teleta]|eukprot:ELU08975.1 hypothetical protein CAPTEDRAFT_189518 [Capitella teleta]
MVKNNHLTTLVSPAEAAEVVEDFLPQPAATLSAIRDLEAKLKLDIKLRRQLIAYLVSLNGNTAANVMGRMMKKLASATVWSQFSLFGKKEKKLSLAGEAEKPHVGLEAPPRAGCVTLFLVLKFSEYPIM